MKFTKIVMCLVLLSSSLAFGKQIDVSISSNEGDYKKVCAFTFQYDLKDTPEVLTKECGPILLTVYLKWDLLSGMTEKVYRFDVGVNDLAIYNEKNPNESNLGYGTLMVSADASWAHSDIVFRKSPSTHQHLNYGGSITMKD